MFSRRAVYANLRDVFINSPSARARARASERGNRGDKERKKRTGAGERGEKKEEARRNGGARSRRIIKCVLPRKFIFILESITRERRRARKEPSPLLLRYRGGSYRFSRDAPRGYVVVDYRDCTLKLTVTRLYIRNARRNSLNRSGYGGLAMGESGTRCEAAKSKIQNRRRAILRVKRNRKVNFPSTDRVTGAGYTAQNSFRYRNYF